MNRVLKILVGIVVAVAVVWLLFEHVFPWVDRNFFADPTLQSAPPPIHVDVLAPLAT